MIKNIIFDIGRVLVNTRPAEFITAKGFSTQTAERIKKASWDDTVHWKELDRGIMEYSDVISLFVRNDPEIADEIREAFSNVKGLVEICPYTVPWINELKSKGFRVYYLSNWFDRLSLDCSEAIAFIPLMDGGIFSWREKVIKPDHEIYCRLLSRYGLEPQESVFIDDVPENVQAARELGIHGIGFENYEQARAELEEYFSR